ncbi:MAG TPA: sodium:solute symporter family protein [Gemmatimonadaceae bacterium]|nr:sodium:solute symporter family protein [Gemmatimonadaceae bacterium]
MPPLLGITLYMVAQFGIGVWVSRRIRTETDYILAGRSLGYGLATFSIFATWFGAETIMGSAGLAYREGVSLGSAEPFGYGLCLVLFGLVFAVPLWKRQFTTLADLYRERYSVATERLAAVILIPSSILWAAAQIRAFGYVLTTSSTMDATTATAIAAGFTILYAAFGGMMVDAITDMLQGVIIIVGLVVILAAIVPLAGGAAAVADGAAGTRLHMLPQGESALSLVESWAIPVAGSVIATELVGRALAARSPMVAKRSFLMGGAMYLVVGSIPLIIGLIGPAVIPGMTDAEQLIPEVARTLLPPALYAIFAGALLSAILSTVDSTLLTSSALMSHNILVPVFGITDEARKVRASRAGVVAFGLVAYVLATNAEGVFALVEEASAFGSAGVLVTASFALFTRWGGSRAAVATLLAGMLSYVAASLAAVTAPYLLSLAVSLATYLLVSLVERRLAVSIRPLNRFQV